MDEDLEWALSSSIDGQVKGSSNSIVTIQDECIAFPLDPDVSEELYFANVGTNDDTTTLTFSSNITKIDTIDDQLVVATEDGHVYMLDKINMSSCGYDATQLDSAKGFSTDDGDMMLLKNFKMAHMQFLRVMVAADEYSCMRVDLSFRLLNRIILSTPY